MEYIAYHQLMVMLLFLEVEAQTLSFEDSLLDRS